jgi:hypothetical protein
MLWFGKRGQTKYQDQLTEVGQACQIGVFDRLCKQYSTIVPNVSDDTANIIVAAIANWIF